MSFLKHSSGIWLWFFYLSSTVLSAQETSSWQSLYDQGLYCDLIPLFEEYKTVTKSQASIKLSTELLMAKVFLELEKMEQVEHQLVSLRGVDWKKESPSSQYEYEIFLARYHAKRENWPKADSLFNVLLKAEIDNEVIRSRVLGEYGLYLMHLQKMDSAEDYLLKCDSLISGASVFSARVFNALAILFLEQSKMRKAGQYFEKAKNVLESNGCQQSPLYWLVLNDYALYFYVQGDLLQADQFLSQSENLQRGSCAVPSIRGFNASARGSILFSLGDHEAAIERYEAAFKSFMQVEDHKDASMALYRIAEVNYFLGNNETAQKYYLQALTLADVFFNNEINSIRAQILMGLASIEEYNYQDREADSLYALAIDMMEEVSGKENIGFATALSNYARFKEVSGDIQGALHLYRQTEALDSILLGVNHPDYKTTLYNLARTYSKLDSIDHVIAYYHKANALQLKLLNAYFGNFAAAARLSYRLEAMGNFDVFFSYACGTPNKDLHREVQDINLATKTLALDYAKGLLQSKQSYLTSDAEPMYQEWLQSRKLLTQLYFSNYNERKEQGISIDSLEKRVEMLEKSVARQSTPLQNRQALVHTDQIIGKLAENEAAIDFFNYYVTDEYGRLPDSILYYASIMTAAEPNPRLVYLCSERELKQILESSSHFTHNVEVNHMLYQLIWAPLHPYLEDIEMIHLSPEGLLHQIAFGGLLYDEKESKTLLERFDFNYYSNLRDFVFNQSSANEISSIYLVGDPDFGEAIDKNSETTGDYFFPLPETSREINQINALLQSRDIQVAFSRGADASEDHFYMLLDSLRPTILHLATHGFFFAKDTSIRIPRTLGQRIRNAALPLMRSGIVLSNVNMAWSTDTLFSSGQDGVVTAQEIADLDLSGTRLVALSACETGRGAIADGEGVFGLQRAFKMAGSTELLISLWDVPDEATSELFVHFYKYLLEGLTTNEALMQAQRTIKLQYPDPYYWAAFVLFK
ncbi:MAG: CHAT domain-containing protein [Saprospiraceae bacterium]|nr:CHAT domain-containing protein [Saprospiraceae bacterium]